MVSAADDELSLSELLAPVIRRWRLLVLMVVVAVCLTALRWMLVAPQYEARARLIVLAPNQAVSDLQTLQLFRNLVPTYKEILSSRRVMDSVLKNLGLHWTPDEYNRRVRIEANEKSQTLDVFVRASSPSEAARIATDAAQIMTRVAAEVMQEERLVLLDQAVPPDKPVSPRKALELSLATMVGLIVGAGIAFAVEVFDRRIRDEASVERRLGLPVLGVIPHIDF